MYIIFSSTNIMRNEKSMKPRLGSREAPFFI